jgi:hypothetical protein
MLNCIDIKYNLEQIIVQNILLGFKFRTFKYNKLTYMLL